jgi:DNA-directed RNA polymerase specialized sigma24 family protein
MTDTDWIELRKLLIHFLRSRGLLSRKLSEDVAQETLLRLHVALTKGTVIRDPLSWCRTTAWRLLADWLPDLQRYTPLTESEGEEDYVSPQYIDTRSPEEIVSARQELSLLPVEVLDIFEKTGEKQTGTERQRLFEARRKRKGG